ncbi:MAG: thioredoxin family protein [Leptolyngbyaceae cyanobacterium SM1_3_5]|nr:thioredoxin family protein [Leptolyngbyaceae cyanobacterium SM1_3_5]
MDRLLQRRQLLLYFGLGVVGAEVGSIALRSQNNITLRSLTDTAPIAAPTVTASPTPEPKQLPEFEGISQWLNSEPLTVASLAGDVVLIQFWTFACINCQRTLPYVTRWHQQYAAQGLKVIGIHTPEFAFERKVSNIEAAIAQHQITYPVPIDNDFQTWKAYENRWWPHLFLADRQGRIRYDHIGEGAYAETEQMIHQLLQS